SEGVLKRGSIPMARLSGIRRRRRQARIVVTAATLAASVGLVPTAARAAGVTWTGAGGSNNWTDAGNWAGGVAPVSPVDSLLFDGVTQTSNNNNYVNATFTGITFNGWANAFL